MGREGGGWAVYTQPTGSQDSPPPVYATRIPLVESIGSTGS